MIDLGRDVVYDDVERMRSKLFIWDGPDRTTKRSAFWVLLVLAAIIATAGVIADSTATVIGAMIVAPLMTPILGTALALVLGNRRQLLYCIGLVLAGALSVVAIGYLVGMLHTGDVTATTNTQVSGRVSPRLIDLLAALATGVVGAFALIRSDVSDTLPGVAIAISLVPPLAVVGLTLESGAPGQARGALLLFATNVAAIIATGTVVLLLYRIRAVVTEAGEQLPDFGPRTLAVVVGAVLLVAVPLTIGSLNVAQQQRIVAKASPVAEAWARDEGWLVTNVSYQQGRLQITALGRPPEANAGDLRRDLDDAGLADVDARVTLVVGGSQEIPAAG
jgi:uncharacterized hydrophobic protein (TIGR00271 family)